MSSALSLLEDVVGWIDGGSHATIGALPSIGHIFAFLTVILVWNRIPRAYAFDPSPQSNYKNTASSMFNPPPGSQPPAKQKRDPTPETGDPPPPPAQWETSSSDGSLDSQQSDNASVCSDRNAPLKPAIPEPPEPSYFLLRECPESTRAERHRFLVARDGNEEKALEILKEYVQWTTKYETMQEQQEERHHDLQFDDVDLYDWVVASQTALHANPATSDEAKQGWQWLPQVVRMNTQPNGQAAVDRNGNRILFMIPALIDDQICSLETYALAIVLYLNRKVCRDSLEKLTILMDLRPGQGWRNISAIRLLPFIKSTVGLTLRMFPERLSKSILYPLPRALSWVFSAVKAVIDPATAAKLVVVSGSAGQSSPMPVDQMTQYVTRDVALLCENERLGTFSC